MAQIRLSDGEWKLMKTLWQRPPRTLGGAGLGAGRGYRLEPGDDLYDAQAAHRRGRVSRWTTDGKFQTYSAADRLCRRRAGEKRSRFCPRSTAAASGMMVSNLVGRGALSEQRDFRS